MSIFQVYSVVKPLVKLVNFIQARGLGQFIKFLEETDVDHQNLLSQSHARWSQLGIVCQRVWELKGEIIQLVLYPPLPK